MNRVVKVLLYFSLNFFLYGGIIFTKNLTSDLRRLFNSIGV